jgi:hypothetical protein
MSSAWCWTSCIESDGVNESAEAEASLFTPVNCLQSKRGNERPALRRGSFRCSRGEVPQV